ncbi:hypothetical protein ACGF3G_12810 [Streptomyces sp. NPDC048179]|uniref:hypothetical protein n=1 Tax=Streptomyces sp. NPDC048179 TaxID=3365506 RepID=UPI00371B5EAD
MAKTGYGKRLAGDEDPHADPDFAHLSPRDREIAVFVDHLHEGHAMGYKAIAAEHPRYGQQACRTSLRRITLAGHLRWIKEHITVEDNSMRWVTRTYWSRTRRSAEWWAEFARKLDGKDVTEDYQPGLARVEEAQAAQDIDVVDVEPEPAGTAHQVLAELRAADSRMALSDADCRSLASLAEEWLSRGATPDDITKAVTDGLPPDVTNPGGFARTRLESKMPPKKSKAKIRQKAARRARISRVIMACGLCDADERTTEIVNGLCRECLEGVDGDECECGGGCGGTYGYVPDTFLPGPRGSGDLPGADEVIDVTARVEALRRAAGLR